MKLKIKTASWSASLPVAMLNKKIAEKIGVHAGDRVKIKTLSKRKAELVTILDINNSCSNGHVTISTEIKNRLKVRDGQKVDVSFSKNPESISLIKEKLMGKELTRYEIEHIIQDVVDNTLSDPEVAMFISAMYRNAMTFKETIYLIEAILKSGKVLDFKEKYVVDKHCIGGIAGNRTTPVVVAICVAAGLTFPKTSSRAITSAAGTADCIEVLSPVEFEMKELKKIVKKTGGCLAWGGALGMVPADSRIITIEKILKIDPTAQLLASIMSKKLADGAKYLLIDIPYGPEAKVTKSKAEYLKKNFEKIARHFGIKIKVVLTKAKEPIGNGIGPALEIQDVMDVLNPDREGPIDLETKSLYLAGEILELAEKAKKGQGKILAKKLLKSGKAWKKFKAIILAQGGKIKDVEIGKYSKTIFIEKNAKIKNIENYAINDLARVAGCPTDKFSGVYLHCHEGQKLKKGDKIITIYSQSKPRLEEALNYYEKKKPIHF